MTNYKIGIDSIIIDCIHYKKHIPCYVILNIVQKLNYRIPNYQNIYFTSHEGKKKPVKEIIKKETNQSYQVSFDKK